MITRELRAEIRLALLIGVLVLSALVLGDCNWNPYEEQ